MVNYKLLLIIVQKLDMNFDHVQIQFGLEKNTFFHDIIQNIDEIQSLILSYIGHKYIGTDCPQPVKVKNQ